MFFEVLMYSMLFAAGAVATFTAFAYLTLSVTEAAGAFFASRRLD
jgi:hypothetical protein